MARKRKDEEGDQAGGRARSDPLKGGKKGRRDKRFGKTDPWFWRWYHREVKPRSISHQDANKADIFKAYDQWVASGKPRV